MADEPLFPLSDIAMDLAEASLEALKSARDWATIDADTHISHPSLCEKLRAGHGDDYFHGRPISAEELLAEMEAASVDMALSWQNPAATLYTNNEKENFELLLAANEYVADSARRYPDKLIPAGWTDPRHLGTERACRMVDHCVGKLGFGVVKLNPAQNEFAIDTAEANVVVDRIRQWGAVPAFHFGADTAFTPAAGLEKVAARIAPSPLIAVHMGGGGASYLEAESLYIESRRLGLRLPNIHFVCSARRETHTESDLITYQLAGEPFSRNISLGSDAPYGRESWNFGGYRAMFYSLSDRRLSGMHLDSRVRKRSDLFGTDSIQNYMGRNIADLMIRAYSGVISRSRVVSQQAC